MIHQFKYCSPNNSAPVEGSGSFAFHSDSCSAGGPSISPRDSPLEWRENISLSIFFSPRSCYEFQPFVKSTLRMFRVAFCNWTWRIAEHLLCMEKLLGFHCTPCHAWRDFNDIDLLVVVYSYFYVWTVLS